MDLGDLRYRIAADTSDLDRAGSRMDDFTRSAKDAERETGGLSGSTKKFGSDAKGATRSAATGMRTVTKETDKASHSAGGLVNSFGGLRSVIATIGAAIGGIGLSRVISETASFQDTMLGLQAVSGATQAQFESLEKQARTLGATTRYSAQQSGEAQRFLAQAGFDVNEVLSATPGILQLATAGQLDLARAADIASNVLGGMRLPVSELARVNDVLASAAASSNTNVEQLGQALSTAAPIAATAGVSIEEAAAAIGALSDAGIQGSRAGTGFLGFIRQLSNITPQAQAVLNSYGLTVADVNVESNGLASVLSKLRDANLSTADAFAIFQSEAGPAAQVLANSADHVADLTTKFGENSGAAQRMAEIIGSGLSDSILSFNSALGESILQLGEGGVGGGFQYLIDKASGVISVYNGMIDEFAESNELTKDQVESLESLARVISTSSGAIGGATAAYVAYRGALVLATAAQAAWNVVARANPYVLAATAIAATVGVLYSLRDVTVEIGNTTARVGDYMVAAWQMTTEAIGGAWDMIAAPLSNAIMSVADVFGETSENSAGFWGNAMDTVIGAGRSTVNGLIGLFRGLSYALAQIIYNISDNFANLFTGISDAASAALSGDWAGVKEAFGRELINPLNGVMEAFVGQQKDYLGELGVAWTTRVAQNTLPLQTLDQWLLKVDSSIDDVGDTSTNTSNSIDKLTKSQREAAQSAEKFDDALLKLTDSLNPLQVSQRQYMQDQMLLQNAWVTGRITALEYFDALQKLNDAQMSSQTASQAYSGGFGSEIGSRGGVGSPTDPAANDSEWDAWLESARTAFSDFDNLNKQAAESFTQGFGNALESMVFDFEDLGSAARGVFESIARSVVNALGQMAAQWLAYQAIQIATGQSAQAAATAGAAATGAGMAAAYAPAAALASLASFGANAVPAQAGLTATTSLASSLAASSGFAGLFDKGGNIRAGQFGIVGERGPEIVNGPANITGRRDTARMMSSGIGGSAANDEGGGYKNVTINNYGSNEVVQSDDGNGRLTIDIMKAEFAKDMRTNGQMYQSLAQNTNVQRKGR